jgi:hypothetical protein
MTQRSIASVTPTVKHLSKFIVGADLRHQAIVQIASFVEKDCARRTTLSLRASLFATHDVTSLTLALASIALSSMERCALIGR